MYRNTINLAKFIFKKIRAKKKTFSIKNLRQSGIVFMVTHKIKINLYRHNQIDDWTGGYLSLVLLDSIAPAFLSLALHLTSQVSPMRKGFL